MLSSSLSFYHWLSSDNRATINYIQSIASNYYVDLKEFDKARDIQNRIAEELNKNNWKSVEVEHIENMKTCAHELDDIESFV